MFGKLFGKQEEDQQESSSKRIKVGWCFKDDTATVVWDRPTPVQFDHGKPTSSKSAQLCPAAIQFDRLHYAINCPVDLHLRLSANSDGQLQMTNVDGPMSTVRPSGLQKLIVMSPQHEWRHPQRPILQMVTPYVFLSDDPVYVNQFPPFLHYNKHRWPGVQICGRFPIDVWPRVHMWALEWHDMSADLILKRGEPLFYVRFETTNPSSLVRLVEAERTEELESYMQQITDVTNYVNQSFQLFETARERRPETLLVEKQR